MRHRSHNVRSSHESARPRALRTARRASGSASSGLRQGWHASVRRVHDQRGALVRVQLVSPVEPVLGVHAVAHVIVVPTLDRLPFVLRRLLIRQKRLIGELLGSLEGGHRAGVPHPLQVRHPPRCAGEVRGVRRLRRGHHGEGQQTGDQDRARRRRTSDLSRHHVSVRAHPANPLTVRRTSASVSAILYPFFDSGAAPSTARRPA